MAALLHSIFFHRIFGNIQPLTRDILDVTFVDPLKYNGRRVRADLCSHIRRTWIYSL